ncbi:hypothetical protein IWQ61_008521 [Dispira simplex]|nr:hypothetical protein IWQ61_008521 [Dispira simplex]
MSRLSESEKELLSHGQGKQPGPFETPRHTPHRWYHNPWKLVLVGGLLVGFAVTVGFSFGPYTEFHKVHTRQSAQGLGLSTLHNGTHPFRKTVILVSFDGFRADYLDRGLTPHLSQVVQKGGFQAQHMTPSFPSVTFPNHYTLVTGLYPEAHGIVGNEFYDPSLNATFYYKNETINRQSGWWGGEPIWVTTVKQGLLSAVDMWPGSTALIKDVLPTYLIPYDGTVKPYTKVDQLMAWLDLPFEERPSFLATYLPEVDSAGHRASPDSVEVNAALELVDDMVGYLQEQLAHRNLTEIVNVIYVSDHGMATVTPERTIYLEDLVEDIHQFKMITGYPLAALTPSDEHDIPAIYETLKQKSDGQPWNVYLRDNIPERFHFRHSGRIAPIVCIPDVGWTFFTRREYTHSYLYSGDINKRFGVHGYDNLDPTMHAIFIAHGPDFHMGSKPLQSSTGTESHLFGPSLSPQNQPLLHPAFANVNVYNILTKVLDLVPAPNNGTTDTRKSA